MEEEKKVGDQPSDVGDKDELKGNEPKSVSLEDHKRALDDMHKFKSSAKELSDKVLNLEKQINEEKEKKLTESQNYKTLFEQYKQKYEDSEGKLSSFWKSYEKNEKHNAVKQIAIRSGMHDQALEDLDMFDLSGVEVERTDQGRFIIHGAENYVDQLKQKKPYLFKSKQTPNFNPGGGTESLSNEKLTPQKVIELEEKWRKTRDPKDRVVYIEAVKRFKAQK